MTPNKKRIVLENGVSSVHLQYNWQETKKHVNANDRMSWSASPRRDINRNSCFCNFCDAFHDRKFLSCRLPTEKENQGLIEYIYNIGVHKKRIGQDDAAKYYTDAAKRLFRLDHGWVVRETSNVKVLFRFGEAVEHHIKDYLAHHPN